MSGQNQGFNQTTPDFTEVVRSIVDNVMMELNVCMPGKIVSYDKATQYASVEIQLYQNYAGNLTKYPVIPKVPVKHPRAQGGKAFIHMPIKSGDDVVVVFSQRSIDNWKTKGGVNDPADARKHHITDAYALIGGSAIPDAFTPETDTDIEIVNDKSAIQVKPDGKFKIKNDQNELFDLLDQTLAQLSTLNDTLNNDTTNTIFGPMKLNSFAIYGTIKTAIDQIKTKLDTLKG